MLPIWAKKLGNKPVLSENYAENFKRLEERLRREDEDRWLSSRFAPLAQRLQLVSLYMFNLELARIAGLVKEPGIAAIRYQWWREAIDPDRGAHAGDQHMVVRAVMQSQIPLTLLHTLIDGHQDAYEAHQPSARPEGVLIQGAAELLGPLAPELGERIYKLGQLYAAARYTEKKASAPKSDKSAAIAPISPAPSKNRQAKSIPLPSVLRPAFAHAALRHAYGADMPPSALKKRWIILRAIMTGRI